MLHNKNAGRETDRGIVWDKFWCFVIVIVVITVVVDHNGG